jgi:hypothetical protein
MVSTFLSFGGKILPNMHIEQYLPFPIKEAPSKWIVFYILTMTNL